MEIRQPSGTGPGAKASDGCSVELYRRTHYQGELDALESFLSDRSVLELGCGTGRLTQRLLSMTSKILAVDSSAEMLACLPDGVDAKQTDISELALNQLFDVVLLASYLYNTPLAANRRSLGKVLRSHSLGGCLLLQVHSASLLELEQGRTSSAGGIDTVIESFEREGSHVEMSICYSIDELSWTHSFQTEVLDFLTIERELLAVGFSSIEMVDAERGWLHAR